MTSLNGLVKISDVINTYQYGAITENNAPLLVSFAPRTTIPTMERNRINDTTGNTCNYKGISYNVIDIQIVLPTHTGFKLENITNEPVAELIITCKATNTSSRAYTMILLCFPIYSAATGQYDAYINQFFKEDVTSKGVNLDTLLYSTRSEPTQVSFSYNSTFYTVKEPNSTKKMVRNSMYVVVFPHGIVLNNVIYAKFTNVSNNIYPLQQYSVPAAVTDGNITVITVTYDASGVPQPTQTTTKGYIPFINISSKTDVFTQSITLHALPPNNTNQTRTTSSTDYYTTSQYKCVPLSKVRVNANNQVYPGATDPTLNTLTERTVAPPAIKPVEAPDANADSTAILIAKGVGGATAVVIALYICMRLVD
jgi:hypothetical protein